MAGKALNVRLESLAVALAVGSSVRGWGARQDPPVAPTTARRWADRPDVRARAREVRAEFGDRTLGRLVAGEVRGVNRLLDLMAHPDARVRLRACVAFVRLANERRRLLLLDPTLGGAADEHGDDARAELESRLARLVAGGEAEGVPEGPEPAGDD